MNRARAQTDAMQARPTVALIERLHGHIVMAVQLRRLLIVNRLPLRFAASTCLVILATVVVAASYVLGAAGRSSHKLFWEDEIVMLTLARLPAHDLWNALLDGTDLNPPLSHLILHSWHVFFREGEIASRVPSIIGVGLAAAAVGIFVGRRLGPLAGFTGVFILLSTDAYRYAYETRPYGVMLGFAGGAIVCWQAATHEGARRLWLVGLFLCLAAAIACQYYAVLLVPAFAVAEIARNRELRRADWPMWAVLTSSLFPLGLLSPLIHAAQSFARGYFSPPRLDTLQSAYESAFLELIVPFVLASGLSGAALAISAPRQAAGNGARMIPAYELMLAVGLLAVPIIGYAAAVAATGAYVPRYFLTSTLGCSIFVPYMIASSVARRHHLLVPLAAVLLLFLFLRDLRSSTLLMQPSPGLDLVYPLLMKDAGEQLPVVVTHPHVFVALVHYAPKVLVSRAVHLYTPEALKSGTGPRYIKGLSRWNPLIHLEEQSAFFARHRTFLVYGPVPNAILSEILRRGGRAVLRAVDIDHSMFAMSRPGPCVLFEISLEEPRMPGSERHQAAGAAD